MTIPKYILPEKQGNYKFMVFKMEDDSYVRFHKLSIEDIPIGLPLPQHPEIVDAFAKEIGIYVKTMGGGALFVSTRNERSIIPWRKHNFRQV